MPARYRFFASITCSLYLFCISAIASCNSFSCFFLRSASALASASSLALCALVLVVLPLAAAGVVPLFPFTGSLLVAPPSRFASFRWFSLPFTVFSNPSANEFPISIPAFLMSCHASLIVPEMSNISLNPFCALDRSNVTIPSRISSMPLAAKPILLKASIPRLHTSLIAFHIKRKLVPSALITPRNRMLSLYQSMK